MRKYTATKQNGNMHYVTSPEGELLLFLPQEHNAQAVANLLNEELATTQAALEASSKALAEARGFIRDVAQFHRTDESKSKGFERQDLLGLIDSAKLRVAGWDSQNVATTTPESTEVPKPKFQVGNPVTTNGFRVGRVENYEYEGKRFFYDVRWNVWDASTIRYKETELELYTDESEEME